MLLVHLELDSEGKPICAPDITNDRGEAVRVDHIRETYEDENVCVEIRQGPEVFTAQTFVIPGAILVRILVEWAGGKCEKQGTENA